MLGNEPKLPFKQKGASALLILIFVGMTALLLLTAFKLYPAYFDHWAIMSVAESFETESELPEMSERDVDKRFQLRLQTNGIRDFNYNDSVLVTMDDGELLIDIDYEKRVNIYKNVDAVVVFKESRSYRY